ncbi:MAG: helix-turn-helix domain-containing protein [Hyphomonadaceae bacterium]
MTVTFDGVQLPPRPLSSLSLSLVEALLDHLHSATFSTKDNALRYTGANRAMLDLCGVADRRELIGRTSRDFFVDPARRRYEDADRLVMRTKRPLQDQLDLTRRIGAAPVWVLLSRWPIVAPSNEIVGVAVLGRLLEEPERRAPVYERLAEAIAFVRERLDAPVDVSELAQRAGVSISQFERDFVSVFGTPPRRYITKVRLEAALELLASDTPIAEVAQMCGYADQSAFTRRFRAVIGMPPSQYRQLG